MSDKNQILGAIKDTLDEVQQILAKSGYGEMGKAEGDEMPPEAAGGEGGEMPPEAGQGDAGGGEMPPPGAEGGEGMPPEAGAEGAGGEGDPTAQLAEQAKQLTDEELDHMIEALMSEKEARHGGEGQGEGAPMGADAGGAPAGGEGAPAPAPEAPSGDEAEKSMKSEFASLAKSMSGIADAVGKLTKEVTDLKAAKPAPAKVAAKPAVTSRTQVLEKSTPVKGRLNKSDTITFVLGEQGRGNRAITAMDVAEINLARNAQELGAVQDRLELNANVKFPTK
jgi:hypothetical protein